MSRLTASPFHKPSPFEFPRTPLSPPETNADMIGPARVSTSGYIAGVQEQKPNDVESVLGVASGLESVGPRFRKGSSIAYHTSDIKKLPARTPQRSPKAFIIVIPPPTLDHEHGQLGHTLSSGPRHRLSQGLLMPLFPTMYGQLTAIAREFNFPSTTGLCLYFHITENGVTMTPRISDETWQFIWNHIFEVATPTSTQRSLISGKIEFDIDLSQARWYASWMSSSNRDHADIPFSNNPSAAPSIAHFRGESKSTSVDEPVDEQTQTPSRPPVRPNGIVAPTARHIPRKLSLVDRYDAMSIRSGSRRSALSPPEPIQSTSHTLSPIVQEDEPKSARHALDSRVMSWRASAVLKPTSLAATGQTSLEPANMPNTLPIDDALVSTPNQELNLADFTWSVSSIGPGEDEPVSPMSWDRLPSIDIAHRMQGSVCMTPSDCTSFGPSDYTVSSPAVSFYRLPSPDIAHRMYEDVPPTPSTITSWGAPLSYPSSPVSYPRALSLDLGDRCVFSPPATPSTATSWGPESWPSPPVSVDGMRSIHLGDRGQYSRPVTPSTATSWGAPLSYPPTPSTPYFVHTPDLGQRVFDDYMLNYKPWGHSWPYSQTFGSAERSTQWPRSIHTFPAYPYFNIYPSAYPHFDLYIAPAGTMSVQYAEFYSQLGAQILPSVQIKLPAVYPFFDIYPAVYPGNLAEIYPSITVNDEVTVSESPLQYPFFDLYPAVRPRIAPYPETFADVRSLMHLRSPEATQYPDFDLYPAIADHNTEVDLRNSSSDLTISSLSKMNAVSRTALDPAFNLYPMTKHQAKAPLNGNGSTTGYPLFNLYPAIQNDSGIAPGALATHYTEPAPVRLVVYPYFDLCTDPVLYPTRHPVVDHVPYRKNMELSVRLSAYPVIDQYPAVYPAFNIYPTVHKEQAVQYGDKVDFSFFEPLKPSTKAVNSSIQLKIYPVFNIYPAIYPFFDLYPVVDSGITTVNVCLHEYSPYNLCPPSLPFLDAKPTSSQDSTSLPINYNIYPFSRNYSPSYPDFNLYPIHDQSHVSQGKRLPEKPIESSVHLNFYPVFNIYPALYPTFNIYPAIQPEPLSKCDEQINLIRPTNTSPDTPLSKSQRETHKGKYKTVSVRVRPSYPTFNLYPSVYPFIDIYPHTNIEFEIPAIHSIQPHSNLHPAITNYTESLSQTSTYKFFDYPILNLYTPVYPYFDLYPAIPLKHAEERAIVNVGVDLQYPIFNLYPAVYPHFELWPAVYRPHIASLSKPSSRLTHSELHAMVMMEAVGSTGSFQSLAEKFIHHSTPLPKTHYDLHYEVFPRGTDFHTPSGTITTHIVFESMDPSRIGARQSGLRPPSARLGLPSSPSPSRRLPALPTHSSRLSSTFDSIPAAVHGGETPSPSRISPSRTSPVKRLQPFRLPLQGTVEQQSKLAVSPTLTRSSSVTTPGPAVRLDRSQSLPMTRPSPRRSDSMVLQRIKAYNASQQDTALSMETLSQFPAPPLPLPMVTRTPNALDRSKYPFA